MTHMTTLWNRRELLWFWTQRELRVRYKQSILGVGWAVLQPAAMAFVFALVFSVIVHVPSDGYPYPLFVYTALVPWTLLAVSVSLGIPSLVNNMNLITKAAFPREIMPLGVIGASVVDFLAAFGVYVIMLIFYSHSLTANVLWMPLLLVLEIALIIGVVFLGSALNVFFRDIRFLVPLIIQIWLFATPIIYPLSLVPERFLNIYALNPMVGIIESYRNIFLRGEPPTWSLLAISSVVTIFVFILGLSFFQRVESKFADII